MSNLWNMKCPKCGCENQIDIQAAVWIRLTSDSTEASDYHRWEPESPASCEACDYNGTVKDFEPAWKNEIAIAQRFDKKVAAQEFQVWQLTVNADHSAVLTCEDGNGNTVFSKAIEFTDFPREGVTLWFADNTIYLPSEH
jgi:hypothetical protein